jgi:hypothetical protein
MSMVGNLEKELREIKAQLEKLKATCKSSDDLLPLQERLGKVDSLKKDGKWVRIMINTHVYWTNSSNRLMKRARFLPVKLFYTSCWTSATVRCFITCFVVHFFR